MKKYLYTTLILIGVIIAGIYTYKNRVKKTNTVNTDMVIKQNIINVGERLENSPVSATFVIYNRGNKDLVIENVNTDCYCTTSKFTRKSIAPRDSAEITLSYDSSRIGPFQGTATIISNSEAQSDVIVMRGNIKKI